MQVNRGKFHEYLGMTLEYNTVGQVKITMLHYIDEIFDTLDKADPNLVVLSQVMNKILF